METIIGPFGEPILFKEKIPLIFFKRKDHYFFVDSFFQKTRIFSKCDNVLFLSAGESLKTLKVFEKHVKWLSSKNATKNSTIVAVGGGSVGDSIGFLASTYLRGVDLVNIPTTWLSAVDSSIGGKTALNFGGYKNQIGTVHPPKEIYFIRELLKTASLEDSEGEILKTLFLNKNKKWARNILSQWNVRKIRFKDLPLFIKYKAQVVKKDPYDVKGFRAVLNLGHSVGHVLEIVFGLSHSDAVKKGLLFTVDWSFYKGYLLENDVARLKQDLSESLPKMKSTKLFDGLKKDKKKIDAKFMNFIFLTTRGPVLEKVKISDVVEEYQRQVESEF